MFREFITFFHTTFTLRALLSNGKTCFRRLTCFTTQQLLGCRHRCSGLLVDGKTCCAFTQPLKSRRKLHTA